jgi:hypothetical protein
MLIHLKLQKCSEDLGEILGEFADVILDITFYKELSEVVDKLSMFLLHYVTKLGLEPSQRQEPISRILSQAQRLQEAYKSPRLEYARYFHSYFGNFQNSCFPLQPTGRRSTRTSSTQRCYAGIIIEPRGGKELTESIRLPTACHLPLRIGIRYANKNVRYFSQLCDTSFVRLLIVPW